ncbi:hypothetical protein CLOM_g12591 [Closterium sp. NIES-68]|nr:hypothetical protein CLOM_g21537 [Closterium sp. NIES-68]GJP53441.1 hypothetical protein CLOM_g12591 [Closterium sp. NIES-68]GJP81372.1 hypothetical protein CLOP_g11534 [Closterium sp. NIES-67]
MKPSELLQRSKGRKPPSRSSRMSIPCLAWTICIVSLLAFVLFLIRSRFIAERAGTAKHRPATNAPFIFNIKTVGGTILLKVKFTDCFIEIARLVQQCKQNHFKDAALQAESETLLRLTHRDGTEWVALSVAPSGKSSMWEGNCTDSIPTTQISGHALIGALTSGVIPPPDNPSIPLSLPSLPYLRVEYVKVSQDSLGLAMAEGVATI